MPRDLETGPAQDTRTITKVADGGRIGVGHLTYAEAALRLLDNGYEPVPLAIGQKRPIPKVWSRLTIGAAQVERWCAEYPDSGIGLRTGTLVGVDIDHLDPDVAHQMAGIVTARLGHGPMRVGLWPKRLFLARTDAPFGKMAIRKLEVLGQGQQFVAFGLHPQTARPYYWPDGETPLDVPLDALPRITEADCAALLAEVSLLLPPIGDEQRRRRSATQSGVPTAIWRNAAGLVEDGRDDWMSRVAFHAVHDAREAGDALDPLELADRAWRRFQDTTDLSRGKRGSTVPYGPEDCARKVRDKLSLLRAGRLPSRAAPTVVPVATPPGLPLKEARALLADAISDVCSATEAWLRSDQTEAAPRVGLRATVGLGKTAVSRAQLLGLQARLRVAKLPHRILVVTPSLALADEAAAGWMQEGLQVAVSRGYEAKVAWRAGTMCRDVDMVRMAVAAGLPVFPHACLRQGGSRCHAFDICDKQANVRGVQAADVVLAAYDTLFSGLPVQVDQFALVVIDEGCWERAKRTTTLCMGDVTALGASDIPRMDDPAAEEAAWTELFALRHRIVRALQASGTGAVRRSALVTAGVSLADCVRAAELETALRVDPGLSPGLSQGARRRAFDLSREASLSVGRETLFRALAGLLEGDKEQDGRVRRQGAASDAACEVIEIATLQTIHPDLRHLPVLHLDATLRPLLASTVLPGLRVTDITAAMPNARISLVPGAFGKTTLVADPRAPKDENRRRANRLNDCVDYVRWQALRCAPRRTLVVTYKDIEAAFQKIPHVVTGHFKAIAGLDVFKDVALLIVIGRPLPSEESIAALSGAYLGHVPQGSYRQVRRGILMRDGTRRSASVLEHEDPQAELLRAAICDDEIIQAIGRGRGVNRTSADPLEVQVLADVALPVVHDAVAPWDWVRPDDAQRMLLAGVAVDSPADAAVLHPGLFESAEAAKKAFQREVFGGQNPVDNPYREMSLKSARYRRTGRGRSWQRVWWIDGAEADIHAELSCKLGPIDGWEPVA